MKTKEEIFADTSALLKEWDFIVVARDNNRPWGGFYVIDEKQAEQFAKKFFPEEDFGALKITNKLSPKILLVEPGKRLSWQYHLRRAEIWRCIGADVEVAKSFTDEEKEKITLHEGDKIKLKQGERHRLIGLNDWGVVAEIWQHTDTENPSDENDIVRIQDDFGR